VEGSNERGRPPVLLRGGRRHPFTLSNPSRRGIRTPVCGVGWGVVATPKVLQTPCRDRTRAVVEAQNIKSDQRTWGAHYWLRWATWTAKGGPGGKGSSDERGGRRWLCSRRRLGTPETSRSTNSRRVPRQEDVGLPLGGEQGEGKKGGHPAGARRARTPALSRNPPLPKKILTSPSSKSPSFTLTLFSTFCSGVVIREKKGYWGAPALSPRQRTVTLSRTKGSLVWGLAGLAAAISQKKKKNHQKKKEGKKI